MRIHVKNMIKNVLRQPASLVFMLIAMVTIACTPEKHPTPLPDGLHFELKLKSAGNLSESYQLNAVQNSGSQILEATEDLPLDIHIGTTKISDKDTRITLQIKARETVHFQLRGSLNIPGMTYEDASFLLPGFWYRKNLRSSEGAPSARISRAWNVREDRLSVPMTAVYDRAGRNGVSVLRKDEILQDALMPYKKGEIIVHEHTDMGFVGFDGNGENIQLTFGYPFEESPKTYIRKLTLAPPVSAFATLKAGESRELNYEIHSFSSDDYSHFVENCWNYAFDQFQPKDVEPVRSDQEIKEVLSQFYKQSYTDDFDLVGFSGVHLHIDTCSQRGLLEVGFVGRVLLNAYNAVELGYDNEDVEMLTMGHNIFKSYENNGFLPGGFLREVVDFRHQYEPEIYSIRRQSEGLFAIMQYLSLEQKHRREHTVLEEKARQLLDRMVKLQQDGFFPRKFTADGTIMDNAGGSTSTAVIPLLMGYKYFNEASYLESARSAARYIESEIISKGDYFSSTLDANCEDKEASIYASSAMYYLGLLTDGEESKQYFDMAEKAAYFALSWYYLWDVPFAPGQMLGDLGFRTRGWGNVSVENNHVDVYIFDFADVMKHLAEINENDRLREMAVVIKSSMREQLLPVEGRMCGIGKVGYYPEVVQHTNWDYGQFGKGYYNDIFAPGWTVTSLWELLSEDRLHKYFSDF